jgi:hypothetical protein
VGLTHKGRVVIDGAVCGRVLYQCAANILAEGSLRKRLK